jgi:hypothetical protein
MAVLIGRLRNTEEMFNQRGRSIMRKSMLTRLGAISLLLVAFQASAVTVNGTNYKQYTGSGTKCPDGSNVFVYGGVKYCKAYRASLSWAIPTTRLDGTALSATSLAGYEVYWTRSSDNAKGTIKISGGTKSTASMDVYTPATYYFAVAAIDSIGLKSPLSTMVQTSLGN